MTTSIDRRMEAAFPAGGGPEGASARHRLSLLSGGKESIDRRLGDLDREWDTERCIQLEAASTIFLGLGLGAALGRKWSILSAVASGMLLVHALSGWYPLLPLLRRAGVRTAGEIGRERCALKALRGDYEDIVAGGASASGAATEGAV